MTKLKEITLLPTAPSCGKAEVGLHYLPELLSDPLVLE